MRVRSFLLITTQRKEPAQTVINHNKCVIVAAPLSAFSYAQNASAMRHERELNYIYKYFDFPRYKEHILLKGMSLHGRENGEPDYIALVGQILHAVPVLQS